MGLSKTDIPCDCAWLQTAADNPDQPVEFDARLNEYYIGYAHGKGQLIIRHCPLCGGVAPKSKRDLMFARISDEERRRLIELTKSLKTLSDVLATLGPPDEDREGGSMIATLEREGRAGAMQAYRTLRYEHLSETVYLTVMVYPGDAVAIRFSGKYLGDSALLEQPTTDDAKPS